MTQDYKLATLLAHAGINSDRETGRQHQGHQPEHRHPDRCDDITLS